MYLQDQTYDEQLGLAIENNQPETIPLLISQGAKISLKTCRIATLQGTRETCLQNLEHLLDTSLVENDVLLKTELLCRAVQHPDYSHEMVSLILSKCTINKSVATKVLAESFRHSHTSVCTVKLLLKECDGCVFTAAFSVSLIEFAARVGNPAIFQWFREQKEEQDHLEICAALAMNHIMNRIGNREDAVIKELIKCSEPARDIHRHVSFGDEFTQADIERVAWLVRYESALWTTKHELYRMAILRGDVGIFVLCLELHNDKENILSILKHNCRFVRFCKACQAELLRWVIDDLLHVCSKEEIFKLFWDGYMMTMEDALILSVFLENFSDFVCREKATVLQIARSLIDLDCIDCLEILLQYKHDFGRDDFQTLLEVMCCRGRGEMAIWFYKSRFFHRSELAAADTAAETAVWERVLGFLVRQRHFSQQHVVIRFLFFEERLLSMDVVLNHLGRAGWTEMVNELLEAGTEFRPQDELICAVINQLTDHITAENCKMAAMATTESENGIVPLKDVFEAAPSTTILDALVSACTNAGIWQDVKDAIFSNEIRFNLRQITTYITGRFERFLHFVDHHELDCGTGIGDVPWHMMTTEKWIPVFERWMRYEEEIKAGSMNHIFPIPWRIRANTFQNILDDVWKSKRGLVVFLFQCLANKSVVLFDDYSIEMSITIELKKKLFWRVYCDLQDGDFGFLSNLLLCDFVPKLVDGIVMEAIFARAIIEGRVARVEQFLEETGGVESPLLSSWTRFALSSQLLSTSNQFPLQLAMANGRVEIVSLLLSKRYFPYLHAYKFLFSTTCIHLLEFAFLHGSDATVLAKFVECLEEHKLLEENHFFSKQRLWNYIQTEPLFLVKIWKNLDVLSFFLDFFADVYLRDRPVNRYSFFKTVLDYGDMGLVSRVLDLGFYATINIQDILNGDELRFRRAVTREILRRQDLENLSNIIRLLLTSGLRKLLDGLSYFRMFSLVEDICHERKLELYAIALKELGDLMVYHAENESWHYFLFRKAVLRCLPTQEQMLNFAHRGRMENALIHMSYSEHVFLETTVRVLQEEEEEKEDKPSGTALAILVLRNITMRQCDLDLFGLESLKKNGIDDVEK